MEQAKVSVFKSRPMKPFLYPHLVTSTPDSHQISKRIKGLLAYSEHYKGNRVDYPNVGPSFPPLRTRDYRKARELTLEIWDPMVQASFLERFLKSQRNLHTIRVLTKQKFKKVLLERLCEILSKISRLNRVQIDFINGLITDQAKPLKIESMRLLPKLKNLDVTVNGKQLLQYSVSLKKVGFGSQSPLKVNFIEKLMKKTPKFHHLDTIKIGCFDPDWLLEGLALVISKLPNFRELDYKYSENLHLSLKPGLKMLNMLAKASKLEILKLGFVAHGRFQILFLKHPIFKAKSLKRTSLSFRFVNDLSTSEDIKQVFDLLEEIPSLYELSVDFSSNERTNIDSAVNQMERISRMTSIRKLRIVFDPYDPYAGTLSAKQAGNILKWIFKMHFLEELDLRLPRYCLEGNGQDISALPRLKKASLHFERWKSNRAYDLKIMTEILEKCHQVRELELTLRSSVHDYQGMTIKLIENLRKLKRLQVFKLDARTSCEGGSNMTMGMIEDLLKTCHELRDLQDLNITLTGFHLCRHGSHEAFQRFQDLMSQFVRNQKYRFSTFNCA